MLQNRNILCICNTEWHGNYIKATVELMKVLSTTNKVLFVENPYTYKDAIVGVKAKEKLDYIQAMGLKSRITNIATEGGGTVYLLTPPLVVPVSFLPPGKLHKFFLNYNGLLIRRTIRKALKRLKMEEDLINIVSFNPPLGVMTGRRFNEKTLIYHCYDEVKGAGSWLSKHGVKLEQIFMKMVDAVIVTSKGLYESKKDWTERCYIVNNAVKASLFRQGFNPDVNTDKKVVGYVGSVDDRLDYDILQHLFTQMPDATFTFVGRITSERGEAILRKYPNVRLEGAKSPEQLPGYSKEFSAGIIPFIKDDFTRGIYPMKINEYLAAGLPVVSTDFSDLSDFEGIIKVADNKEDFLRDILEEINTDTTAKRQSRLDIAEGNTWQKRADEMSEVIEKVEAELASSYQK
ncbi:glycosyltransferase [Mucilaginibacter terrenus]|uniref:Glycosyltransferase n=1 Tax=Mucilaginibacter terrenus TaxID=2482727 RepID=A0A3E2NNY1_9SPHI|nr:glycosyltransferase [Mucilaginibacter terrenus]RFZ82697.1 glycosyltransferase [Mucilaginibacter terrenus]